MRWARAPSPYIYGGFQKPPPVDLGGGGSDPAQMFPLVVPVVTLWATLTPPCGYPEVKLGVSFALM